MLELLLQLLLYTVFEEIEILLSEHRGLERQALRKCIRGQILL